MTDKTVLIVGYGRAGKRHAALAKGLGLQVYVYDPNLPRKPYIDSYHNCMYRDYSEFLEQQWFFPGFDYIIICTPPDLHLKQISHFLEIGAKAILCEKPLCAIGQLDEAKTLPPDAPVMVAYNYRYHPKLVAVKGKIDSFNMYCEQYRIDLPEWGLLLDHCSHDLDIVRMVTSSDINIISAKEKFMEDTLSYVRETLHCWEIETCQGFIMESITNSETKPREAQLLYPYPVIEVHQPKRIDIDPDPVMFSAMWQAFLAGDYYPDLAEAIKTQELLEQCYRLNEERMQ